MDISYIIALFAGIFVKIVDEIDDVNFLNLKEYKEYFYSICTLFSSLFLYNDIFIAVCCIFLVIPGYFLKELDTVYWKTMIPLPFITFLLTMNTLQYINIHDIVQQFFFIFSFIILCILEGIVFPEENSNTKIIMRICMIVYIILLNYSVYLLSSVEGYITYTHSSISFLHYISMFGIGYLIVSIISKTLFTQDESKKDE
jgi:hypothetical protein